ncbi:concanavalin A-like lectin/glucanase [Lizonia empirigonia]|nr:concanavalin A-like lectin/glucanase [Lizonia empirigonia]
MLFQVSVLVSVLAVAAASPVVTQIEQSVNPVRRQAALCSQYAYYAAKGYTSPGNQCTSVQSTSDTSVSWSTSWTWQGGQDNVKSYANVGKQFARGLIVGNIKSMWTNVQWDYQPRDSVRANVAYDVFTAADPNHDKSSGDYEVMVWLARIGGVYPIGSKVTTVNIAGFNWDLYVGPNGSMKVFSFIPADGSWKFSFNVDIKQFFNYLASNQEYSIYQQNLIVFQQGTEPFTGGPTTYSVSSYSTGIDI